MTKIFEIIVYTIRSYSISVVNLFLDPIVLFIGIMIFGQYRSNVMLQRNMYGANIKYKRKDLIITSILFGLLGGLIGSILTGILGITFKSDTGLEFVILLSIFFMFINPRYICLAYSGGAMSIFMIVFNALSNAGIIDKSKGIPNLISKNVNFDITALLFIIAIMHLIESMLIWIDGHKGAVPIFMKKGDKVVGAFIMQKYWIIPLILFVSMKGASNSSDLLGYSMPQAPKWLFSIALPLVAMLGYGDFSVATSPETKAKRTSRGLLIYSLILLVMSVLSSKIYVFKIIAAIYAPVMHEALIIIERYREFNREPIWKMSDEGIVVLDTLPNSPCELMGIKSGDIIMSLNDQPVKAVPDVEKFFDEFITDIYIKIKDLKGNIKTLEYKDYEEGIDGLGIITIPEGITEIPMIQEKATAFEEKIAKLLRKIFK